MYKIITWRRISEKIVDFQLLKSKGQFIGIMPDIIIRCIMYNKIFIVERLRYKTSDVMKIAMITFLIFFYHRNFQNT